VLVKYCNVPVGVVVVMAVHVFLDFGGIEAIGVFGVGLVVLHAVLCGPPCLSHIGYCILCGRGALAGYVVDCPMWPGGAGVDLLGGPVAP
jgi:hypothetical protein